MGTRQCAALVALIILATACGTTTSSDRMPAEPVTTIVAEQSAPGSLPDPAPAVSGDTVEADFQAGSREMPVTMGSLAPVGDWLVRVTGVEPDGAAGVLAASEFNEPPGDGKQYFVVDLEAFYAGDDSGTFWVDTSWSAVGPSALAYDPYGASCGMLARDLSYVGEVWPGGAISGQICFAVAEIDATGLQLILDEGFGGEGRTFFALQEGDGVDLGLTAPQRAEIDESGLPGSRGNPIMLGSTADLGDWFVRVDGVIPDATQAVAGSDYFNEYPQPGSQYFMAEVTIWYFGADPGASAGSVQLRLLGPDNVAIDSWDAPCGFVPSDISSAGALYPGGSVGGTVCFEVPTDQVDDVVLVADAFGFSQERAFLATATGAGSDPGIVLPAPPAVGPGAAGSWNNPFDVGSSVAVGDWLVRVVGVERDATRTVLAASEFNTPPAEGFQYTLVTLEATYEGSSSGTFWSDLSWGLLGSGRVAYSEFSSSCGTIPNSISSAPEVFPAGVITGNICLAIPRNEAASLALTLEDFIEFDEKVFLLLE